MASIPQRLLLQSRQCPSRIRLRGSTRRVAQWQRPLSTTTRRFANKDTKDDGTAASTRGPTETVDNAPTATEQSDPSTTKNWKDLSPADRDAHILSTLSSQLSALDPEVIADAIRKGKQGIPFAQDFNLEQDSDFEIEEDDKRKIAAGFWAEGEEEMGPDEDYFGDDLTTHGHGELEQHRELREYARLIAWELPLLSHLARPFTPPTPATPFRFRYTSYLGESHPATNKVVVEFSPPDLALTPQQTAKLIKLAGPRYNPSTENVKLSCESYDTQAQNKRHLADTLTSLLAEAKDTTDTFADVPFDFRHHKVKPRFEFPKEWVLTPERKRVLEEKRARGRKAEDDRMQNGNLVDGKTVVETSLPFLERQEVLEPVGVGRRR